MQYNTIQVYVALALFYQHIVNVYWGVVFNHQLCLCDVRLLSTDSYCSICCSSNGVPVHKNMSSAKRRLSRKYPSTFTPLFSLVNLLNMLSNVAAKCGYVCVYVCVCVCVCGGIEGGRACKPV